MFSSPDLSGSLTNEVQLGLLIGVRNQVSFFGGGKAALRTKRQSVQRNVSGGSLNTTFQFILILECRLLRRNQPQNHRSAFGHLLQWFESTRTFVIVFEQESLKARFLEDLRDRTIVSRRVELALIVSSAHVKRK